MPPFAAHRQAMLSADSPAFILLFMFGVFLAYGGLGDLPAAAAATHDGDGG